MTEELPPIETILRVAEIYGVFTECEGDLTVMHREKLLYEMEKKHIPILINYKEQEYIKKVLVEYNRNIGMNMYDNKPVDLD